MRFLWFILMNYTQYRRQKWRIMPDDDDQWSDRWTLADWFWWAVAAAALLWVLK